MEKNETLFRLKEILISLALLVLLSIPVVSLEAGKATKESNAAKKSIEKSVKAMGGQKKATGWNTRIDKGLLTSIWPGWGTLKANCTRHVKKPDKMKLDQDYSAYDHPFFFTYYYNRGDVWAMINLGTRQNPRYTERMTKQMRRIDGLAYFLAECDTFFLVTDVPDDSLFTASDIERVGVIDNGDTVLFDLDRNTHMPVRRIEDSGSMHVLLDDYRKTGGLKIPFHITAYQNGNMVAEYKWEEIKFNQKIDDAIFEEFRPKETSGED